MSFQKSTGSEVDLMIGSRKGDPEADYLTATELARLQGAAR
jgi:hypothetical protein